MNYEIRELTTLDQHLYDQVDFIEKQCFGDDDAFPTEDIPEILLKCQSRVGVYNGETLVGYALARHGFGVGYLYSNAVLPLHRRKGLGQLMFDYRFRYLENHGCSIIQANTKTDNEESGNLLLKNGFKPVQYVTDFYDDNIDAILWSRSI
jgi:ribosomal protein S18 acetylase RimI-like enzyme